MTQIRTIVVKNGRDFTGSNWTIQGSDRLYANMVKSYKDEFTVVVDKPVGPEWLRSKWSNAANLQIDQNILIPNLGDAWNPSGICVDSPEEGESILDFQETKCVGIRITRGPYNGSVQIYEVGIQSGIGGCLYDVECTYETHRRSELAATPPDQTDPDPLNWVREITVDGEDFNEVAENGTFLGLFQSVAAQGDPGDPQEPIPLQGCTSCPGELEPEFLEIKYGYVVISTGGNIVLVPSQTREIGSCGPFINSAGEKFDSVPEVVRDIKRITITSWVPTYDITVYQCFEQTVNEDAFRIEIPQRGFTLDVAKHCMKCVRVSASFEQRVFRAITGPDAGKVVSRDFWRLTYELLYDRRGFYRDYLNEGSNRITAIATSIEQPNLGVTALPLEPITVRDPDGTISKSETPQKLDEYGQVLEAPRLPFYVRYLKEPQKDFTDTGFGLGIAIP